MDAEVTALIARLGRIKEQAKESSQDLPLEALNWNPIPGDANSVYAIMTHMCGTESFMVHKVIGQKDVQRDRDAEFAAKGNRMEDLVTLMDRTQETTQKVLESESTQSLNRPVQPFPNRPPMSVREALLYTIEHVSTHLGHLHMTKQWWESQRG